MVLETSDVDTNLTVAHYQPQYFICFLTLYQRVQKMSVCIEKQFKTATEFFPLP